MFTGFGDYLGATYRDDRVPRDVHTLQQPYGGLVVEFIDAIDGDRDRLHGWLAAEYLPEIVGGPVPVALCFAPRPLPADHLSHVRQLDGVEGLVTVLHFLDVDPRDCWADRFAASADRFGAAGALAVQAAFVPTRHGTDAYCDDLF